MLGEVIHSPPPPVTSRSSTQPDSTELNPVTGLFPMVPTPPCPPRACSPTFTSSFSSSFVCTLTQGRVLHPSRCSNKKTGVRLDSSLTLSPASNHSPSPISSSGKCHLPISSIKILTGAHPFSPRSPGDHLASHLAQVLSLPPTLPDCLPRLCQAQPGLAFPLKTSLHHKHVPGGASRRHDPVRRLCTPQCNTTTHALHMHPSYSLCTPASILGTLYPSP